MRIKAFLVLATLAAATTAAPALAQPQGRSCQEIRQNNQVGGAIVGGILGGVLGNNIASNGHRSDGTTLGAVVGGIIGAGVGGSSVPCHRGPGYGPELSYPAGSSYYPNPNYGGPRYHDSPYDSGNDGYSPYRYGSDVYGQGRYGDITSQRRYQPDLDGGYPSDYTWNDDFAGRDCSEATHVTHLPDGSEVRRPVTVCYDDRSGDWRIRD